MVELQLLNCVLAKRDFGSLVRHGIAHEKHFIDNKDAFIYIKGHLSEYGEVPSIESVIMECPDFEAVEVVESIDTLALKLQARNLKLAEKKALEEIATAYAVSDPYKLLETMKAKVEELSEIATYKGKNGVNWSQSGQERFQEYTDRKERDLTKKFPTMFEEVTESIGEYEAGALAVVMASTGKGKSWIGAKSALEANKAGHIVLFESGEMSKDEVQFRLDTLDGGFSNRGLWHGELKGNEAKYKEYTDQFKKGEATRPDLIIKTPSDWGAGGLTLQQLQYDIEKTKASFIVIDQFNLLAFKSSNHADKADFSRKLKQLAAKLGVCILVLYQTNGEFEKSRTKQQEKEQEKGPILKSPSLSHFSESIALIQDASVVYGFDSIQNQKDTSGKTRGKALLTVLKARNGISGKAEFELNWTPDDGNINPRRATDMF